MLQLRSSYFAICFLSSTLLSTGCSSGEDKKTPKLTGDAATKYDVNAKPVGRSVGGSKGGAAPAGPSGKD